MLDRLLDPFGAFLTPEVARKLVNFRVDELTQSRIDELADKCNEGQLTPTEREEYDTYISVIDFLTALQAKARLASIIALAIPSACVLRQKHLNTKGTGSART